jgi:hypothetical protein
LTKSKWNGSESESGLADLPDGRFICFGIVGSGGIGSDSLSPLACGKGPGWVGTDGNTGTELDASPDLRQNLLIFLTETNDPLRCRGPFDFREKEFSSISESAENLLFSFCILSGFGGIGGFSDQSGRRNGSGDKG